MTERPISFIMQKARRRLEAYCEQRVPKRVRHQVRLEVQISGYTLTLIERRAPWTPDIGQEWTTCPIARFRHVKKTGLWTLFCRNRNLRWWQYPDTEATTDFKELLAEVDEDPTGIFWG